MGEVKMFPMTFVHLEKDGRTASIVYADSSKRVIGVVGDLPVTFMNQDATLCVTRLISAGWKETSRGKVTDESI